MVANEKKEEERERHAGAPLSLETASGRRRQHVGRRRREGEGEGALLSEGSMIAQNWPVKARIRWRSTESILPRLFSVRRQFTTGVKRSLQFSGPRKRNVLSGSIIPGGVVVTIVREHWHATALPKTIPGCQVATGRVGKKTTAENRLRMPECGADSFGMARRDLYSGTFLSLHFNWWRCREQPP